MKWAWVLIPLLCVVGTLAEDDGDDELPLAVNCDAEACQLPDCRCSSVGIPGGLAARDTPQFVLVTFDDGVNILNIETYRDALFGRTNPDGCPAGATFYVSHEYTNYQLVNELYRNGFEIALHSITHRTPQTFWAEADYETLRGEFADQRVQMAHFANIPIDSIQGMRLPFLQLAGNASFEVIKSTGMTYDASWPTVNSINPGLWPYTLDYASGQDCSSPPCPTASIEGTWVLPMVTWRDLNNNPCAMVDSCFAPPDLEDEDEWFKFISLNFERHYLGNRAPFGFYVHEWFVRTYPAVNRAFVRFLDTINNIPDVFMVNSIDVINWVRNPQPIDEYRARACPQRASTFCAANNCGPLAATHTQTNTKSHASSAKNHNKCQESPDLSEESRDLSQVTPDLEDEDEWFKFISLNFERHYLGNRAPFGFYVHEWFVRTYPAVNRAFVRFLDTINNIPDVFMVNSIDAINWVRNSQPTDEYRARACPQRASTFCAASNCGPLAATHTQESFWMAACNVCPRVYPWFGNPLGV